MAFAADVLMKLGANASIEGLCLLRRRAPQLQTCFLCRVTATWRSGRLLHQEPAAAQEPEPEEERQSSAKFHELAGIIAGLGETKPQRTQRSTEPPSRGISTQVRPGRISMTLPSASTYSIG